MRLIICISLREIFSSVGYHLRGYSRVRYLLRFVKGAWNQKSKRVDWNHNPIVLLKDLIWKPWISGTSSLGLKLKESGCRPSCVEPLQNLVFAFSLPYSFNLYAIVFILFYYILAYNCLLHSYFLNLLKKIISIFTPLITLDWINLIFLTKVFKVFSIFLIIVHNTLITTIKNISCSF